MAQYLNKKIVAIKKTHQPNYGLTVWGYTKISGAPTSRMIQLEGENRWRRLMFFQTSNLRTLFVRVKGKVLLVLSTSLPD